jgi:hypothetical protein
MERVPFLYGLPALAASTWTTATAMATSPPYTPSASARCPSWVQFRGTQRPGENDTKIFISVIYECS